MVESGPQVLSAGVRRTIQSIKEVVGSHSDADIYVALKEANMDPNETAQKLLVQDPFHRVQRKRDRRKENSGNKSFVPADGWKNPDTVHVKTAHSVHDAQKVVSVPKASTGSIRAFRVVRDNRVNQNTPADSKPEQGSVAKSDGVISDVHMKGNSSQIYGHQKPPVSQRPSSAVISSDLQPRRTTDFASGVSERKDVAEKMNGALLSASSRAQTKSNGPKRHPAYSSSSSVMGVYTSSSDPVHKPSRNSSPASNVEAIRRGVGVAGSGHQLADNSSKNHQSESSSSMVGQDGQSRDPGKSHNVLSRNEESSINMIAASGVTSFSIERSRSSNNQYGSRSHHPRGNQKGYQPSMEWRPKSILQPSANAPADIGSLEKASGKNPDELRKVVAEIHASISQLRVSENQNVIIAPHIQVSETDRCRLTFGSLEIGSDSSSCTVTEGVDKLIAETTKSASVSTSVSSEAEPTSANQETQDEPVQSHESRSSVPPYVPDIQHMDNIGSSASENLENYADFGLVQSSSPPYMPQQLLPEENELSRFSGYDPQMRHDSWLRHVGDNVRAPSMPSSQEVLSSHAASGIPASSIAMVQQQQQMYPQLHVSHFSNHMPYRQFLSPVYVPPMPVPAGYSNNPSYNHLSNGNSFVLMPGNNTHLPPGGAINYGVRQFNPTANPNGYSSFTNPSVYSINANGVVGSSAGHDDSTHLQNLYVRDHQPETSEIWMNTRDHTALQSAPYYSMPGQSPHPAYLTSHGSHASFPTAVAAQSSHMQFSPIYHHPTPQQAPSTYQSTNQLGHMNWSGNF